MARIKKAARKVETPANFIVNSRAVCIAVEVDDPYFNASHAESRGNTRKTTAMVNARESPALWMYTHNNIDTAQFEAAKHFRKLYETAQGTGIQSQDFMKEPVDGGYMPEPLTDRRQRAAKELAAAHNVLGRAGYLLVESVCAHCMEVAQLYSTDWARKRERRNLKDSLDRLASFWGFKTRRGVYYRDAAHKGRPVHDIKEAG